jgi:hypothetical protein
VTHKVNRNSDGRPQARPEQFDSAGHIQCLANGLQVDTIMVSLKYASACGSVDWLLKCHPAPSLDLLRTLVIRGPFFL